VIMIKSKVRLNHRLFTTSTFDSGALGVLASVVHQFQEGRYIVDVNRDQKNVGSTNFLVESSSANMQLIIDLTAVSVPVGTSTPVEIPTVSPKGYVMFYVSGGVGGYSVVAREESGSAPVFDSTTLSAGDLFAVSLIEPATYWMVNQAGNATGEIQVTTISGETNPLNLPTQYVDVNNTSFDPAKVTVHSAQGLVFRIKGPARVVINKQPGTESATPKFEGKQVRRRVRVSRVYYSDQQQKIGKQVRRRVRLSRPK
jgi:hypothetical protein